MVVNRGMRMGCAQACAVVPRAIRQRIPLSPGASYGISILGLAVRWSVNNPITDSR